MAELHTKRLTLRPFQPDDFEALHALVSDWQVVRQLGGWPWPPEPDLTRSRAAPYDGTGDVWAILRDGGFVGSVGVNQGSDGRPGIGYMLARAHHGQGLMSEAARAALAYGFAQYDWDQLVASTWFDNPASDALLRKFGFQQTGRSTEMSMARKVDTEMRHYALSRADWAARCPLRISDADLTLRPLGPDDIPALRAGLGVPEVSHWLHSIPAPWPEPACAAWVAEAAWTGHLNTRLAIEAQGQVQGVVGLHQKAVGDVPFLSFAVMPSAQGRGLATRAARALIGHVRRAYDLAQIDTLVLTENAASIRVLEKLGFVRQGGAFPSPKLAPRLDYHYRLSTA